MENVNGNKRNGPAPGSTRFTVLVTGVGAIIGYGIIDGLRKSQFDTKIIGIDIYEDAYGGVLCDEFVKGERADSPGYIDFINVLIEKYKIDLIFPGVEYDLFKLWDNKQKVKTRIVLNNDLCLQLSRDKYYTYTYLSAFDLDLIPTIQGGSFRECAGKLGLPFLIKPTSSQASKGIEKIDDEMDFDFYTHKLAGKCIYQRIVGTIDSEYTISVFGDGSGEIQDHIILKRTLSREGATNKAVVLHDESILAYVKKICSIIKPVGPLNIQVRKEGEKVFLLEINPRFSSACSIRTLLGYNEPEMCIKYFLLEQPIAAAKKGQGKVIRYISDYYSK